MLIVIKKIKGLAFANAWVWLISLSLFPAVTGGVSTITGPGQLGGIWSSKVIFTGLHYLVYNCGDWTGRIITGLSDRFVVKNSTVVALVALLRTAFIPLFIMCNSETPQTGSRFLPTVIKSDAGYFVILILFALTNGWTSSVAFMNAPQLVTGAQEEEVAGVVQSFGMSLGSTFGSIAGFGVRALVCRCNSFVS